MMRDVYFNCLVFYLQDNANLFETYDVELIKKNGQSLGITIVGYAGTCDLGEF